MAQEREFTAKEKEVLSLLHFSKRFTFSDIYPMIYKNKEFAKATLEYFINKKMAKKVEDQVGIFESLIFIESKK